MNKRIALTIAAAAATLAPPAAFAEPTHATLQAKAAPQAPRWSITAGPSTRWMTHSSAAVVASSNLGGGAFGVQRALAISVLLGRELLVTVGGQYADGEATGTLFSNLESKVSQTLWQGTLGARRSLWRSVGVRGQLGLGAAKTSLQIQRIGSDTMAVDDGGWSSVASLEAGVDLMLLRRGTWASSASLSVGYTAVGGQPMSARSGSDVDPDLMIQTDYASLGNLNTSGWQLAFAWSLGF